MRRQTKYKKLRENGAASIFKVEGIFKLSLNFAGALSCVNKHTVHQAAITEGAGNGQVRENGPVYIDRQALSLYSYFFFMVIDDWKLEHQVKYSH